MDEHGPAKCARCGKERPRNELKTGTIIFQNARPDPRTGRYKKFVDEKTNLYCADGPCHAHDQMAHEG